MLPPHNLTTAGEMASAEDRSSKDFSSIELGVSEIEELFRSGRVAEIGRVARYVRLPPTEVAARVRLSIVEGTALFECGDVIGSIEALQRAFEQAATQNKDLEFAAALALFSRESQFQSPQETLPSL